jgi:hypothetical protein
MRNSFDKRDTKTNLRAMMINQPTRALSKLSASYDTRKFDELITTTCPSYELIASNLRGEMRLYVLALEQLAEEISDVYVAGENTGIGGVMANKGGIIVTLTVRGTRLSFMTCHLEAHEGAHHYVNRNKNLAEILGGAKPDPDYYMLDTTIYSHHMFVCGDLNYRIKFSKEEDVVGGGSGGVGEDGGGGNKPITKQKTTRHDSKYSKDAKEEGEADNGSHFAQAKTLVEEKKWKELNSGDELAMALKKRDCLTGFKTLPCNFPPTFKVSREAGYVYNEKRTPRYEHCVRALFACATVSAQKSYFNLHSYTDRILWKSTDDMNGNIIPMLYEPCPDFITSDHKPIRGGFAVKMNKRYVPLLHTRCNNVDSCSNCSMRPFSG